MEYYIMVPQCEWTSFISMHSTLSSIKNNPETSYDNFVILTISSRYFFVITLNSEEKKKTPTSLNYEIPISTY